ncbi:IclR family transcriptional regulator [Schaalia sp. lx-260]|uniref:IclR family transcriptional regulator n=1 Tax=Schaalia sp. lx-260 TaxID=2899082 RepID=UPI001E6482D7|nr:IclR family transcriptional regulator [Schaalia sp. lx-260]MCD4548916.1 IclR family transcriptional regulator [Schaalia sp. lx-260]
MAVGNVAPTPSKRSTTITSVDKALRIIEHMSTLGPEGQTLLEIATALSMNKSSLHHTLATLRARDWVTQDHNGNYHLGTTSSIIARWWNASERLTTTLHPILESLCAQSHELVHLGQLSEKTMVYLDKVEPDRAVRVWSQIGRRIPAATTAMGRSLMGVLADHTFTIDTWITAVKSPANNLAERIQQEIERVRTHGYAIEIEENEPGIACVAIPLLVAGQATASVSITMPIERCSHERLHDLAGLLTKTVTEAHIPQITTFTPQP